MDSPTDPLKDEILDEGFSEPVYMIVFQVIEDTAATRMLYSDRYLPDLHSMPESQLRYQGYDLTPAARAVAEDGVITLQHTSPDQFARFLPLLEEPEPDPSICDVTQNYLDCISIAFDLDDTAFKKILIAELYHFYMLDWDSGNGTALAYGFEPMLETIYKNRTWLELKSKRRCADLVIAMLARQVMSKEAPRTIDASVYCELVSYFEKMEWRDIFLGHLAEQLSELHDFNAGKALVQQLPIERFLPIQKPSVDEKLAQD